MANENPMTDTNELRKAAEAILRSYKETGFDPAKSTDHAVMLAVALPALLDELEAVKKPPERFDFPRMAKLETAYAALKNFLSSDERLDISAVSSDYAMGSAMRYIEKLERQQKSDTAELTRLRAVVEPKELPDAEGWWWEWSQATSGSNPFWRILYVRRDNRKNFYWSGELMDHECKSGLWIRCIEPEHPKQGEGR